MATAPNSQLTLDESLSALKSVALDDFSRLAIDGARYALADTANPLRLNFFSTAMRILFEHMMGTLAPDHQVMQTPWFLVEKGDGKPTRAQRIKFAIQGGLADSFVNSTLAVDIGPLRKRLIGAVNNLGKHVHGREDTIIVDTADQDAAARTTIDALRSLLATYHDCRAAIVDPIQQQLDDTTVDALISESIMEVDDLASHWSFDEVCVEDTSVKTIGPNNIIYRAKGSIDVTLQWGSNSDVRRGDGIEIAQSFPFHCDIEVPLIEPWDLTLAEFVYHVDTSKWHDMELDWTSAE